jgi:hypothetical protein
MLVAYTRLAYVAAMDQADAAGSVRVARRITENQMMATAKQIAARRNVTCPAHHLELGMA